VGITTSAPPAVRTAGVTCSHCGLVVPPGLLEPGAAAQFCCTGCRTAWTIIHEVGLDRYYELAERREAPVTPSGRSYAEFDHPAFRALYVRERPDGLVETRLYLEGVHCASCVWLVERVSLAIPGVASAELDIGRSLARLVWDEKRERLSAIARFLDHIGYRPHPFRGLRADEARRAEDRAALVRIGVAGALAANLMTVAFAMYAGWFGHIEPQFERYFRWISLLLATAAFAWPGRGFFQSAWAAVRARTLHMDVPIAVALGAGFLRGAINTASGAGPIYFDGLAILIFLLLVGRFLQQRAQRAAVDSAELLYALSPANAHVADESGVHDVPAEALLPGMVLEVRAAETIPADGVVLEGTSEVVAALLTGESLPVGVGPGAQVFAGTLNRAALLRMRVDLAGEESRLGRMLREVAEGARRRAPVVKLADRVSGWFIAAVLTLAVVTFLLWASRDTAAAFDNAIALLIVTCPCALAMATPLAMTVGIGRAARAGILIKGGDAIERLARTGRLVLDKTGTVTEGRSALTSWSGPEDARPLVLALERHSSHPVAEGFRRAWPNVTPPAAADDTAQSLGGGVAGTVEGHAVVVGSPAFVLERAADPRGLAATGDGRATPVAVAVDGVVVGLAAFGDPVRPEARAALDALRERGWTVELLSGDAASVADRVGRELGFPPAAVRGGASPEDKLRRIEAAAAGGGTVVMVGDGVNDAAAMARADVGIGVHGGAEACLATADVFLSRPGILPLVQLVEGAHRAMGVIRRNMAISLGYNLIGATLAMTGYLTPLVAAVLMPISSVTVVLGSWRSRTFEAEES
jgi:P-type Cu2+ transporter